jgi:hypothetical protein
MARKSRASRAIAVDRITAKLDAAAARVVCPLVHISRGSGPDTCARCGRPIFWIPPAPTPTPPPSSVPPDDGYPTEEPRP